MHIYNTFIWVMKNIFIMPSNIAWTNKSKLYAITSFFKVCDNCEVYWNGSHGGGCNEVGGVELGDKVPNDTTMESNLIAPSC